MQPMVRGDSMSAFQVGDEITMRAAKFEGGRLHRFVDTPGYYGGSRSDGSLVLFMELEAGLSHCQFPESVGRAMQIFRRGQEPLDPLSAIRQGGLEAIENPS